MPDTYQASPEIDENAAAILLAKGGWLPANAAIDAYTMDAVLRSYQSWHGLYVDGFLGAETLASLQEERFCAHPDSFEPPLSFGGGINRWGKKNLKIQVVGNLGPHSNAEFRDGVIVGARTWSKFCGITFDLVDSGGDIVIDSAFIDGPGKTLAWMQLPSSDGFNGRLQGRWGASENWPNIIVAVSAHEIGHALGMGHTNVANQLMNPILSRYAEPQEGWDRPQARARYGRPDSTIPPPEPPPHTPPTPTDPVPVPPHPVPPETGWTDFGWTPKGADVQFNVRWRNGSAQGDELMKIRGFRSMVDSP